MALIINGTYITTYLEPWLEKLLCHKSILKTSMLPCQIVNFHITLLTTSFKNITLMTTSFKNVNQTPNACVATSNLVIYDRIMFYQI